MANFCPACGTALKEDHQFCPNCGTPIPGASPAAGEAAASDFTSPASPAVNPPPVEALPHVDTKKEYLLLPENKKKRTEIRSAAIICYICAGATLVASLTAGNMLGLLDVAILVGLGLGIHLAQSRVCAVLLCAYGVFNLVASLVLYGSVGGWLIIIAGIFSAIYTFKLNSAWQAYHA